MQKLAGLAALLTLPLTAQLVLNQPQPQILGAQIAFAQNQPTVTTITSFEQKEKTETEVIPFPTEYVPDPDTEIGIESITTPGREGAIHRTYLVTYWYGEEAERQLITTEQVNPKIETVAYGTKVVWQDLSTPDAGKLAYWRKIDNVWATSYDKSCLGCNEWTALGTKLDYGTCAVDPKVIKLRTKIYVPGYGLCQALDVGSGINGNEIDVGFYDLHAQSSEVGWRGSHYTTIYLLDQPQVPTY